MTAERAAVLAWCQPRWRERERRSTGSEHSETLGVQVCMRCHGDEWCVRDAPGDRDWDGRVENWDEHEFERSR